MEDEERPHLGKDNPYRIALVQLLHSIDEQIPLSEGSYLTIRYHLETEKAVSQFAKWVGDHLNGEILEATEAEIVRAAVQASREPQR